MTTGPLTRGDNTAEIVLGSRRDSALYLKVFSFNPETNKLRLRQRTIFAPIKTLDYTLTIKKHAVIVKGKTSQTLLYWKPSFK